MSQRGGKCGPWSLSVVICVVWNFEIDRPIPSWRTTLDTSAALNLDLDE